MQATDHAPRLPPTGPPRSLAGPRASVPSMDLGLHLPNFTFPDGPAALATDVRRAAQVAEEAGFTKLSVMDHVWQIRGVGPREDPMLEAYTTLGYLAAV